MKNKISLKTVLHLVKIQHGFPRKNTSEQNIGRKYLQDKICEKIFARDSS
jgi:hypothetical protein